MNDHFVYIIYSELYNLHYFGHTNNLEDRLLRHNSNRNKFTKTKDPGSLLVLSNAVLNQKLTDLK